MPKAAAISLALFLAILFLASTLPPTVNAQGCAMCYTTAEGQSPAAARRLDMAILAWLLPVLTHVAGVLTLAIRRRDSSKSEPPNSQPAPTEPVGARHAVPARQCKPLPSI
jgi:hypothetical protein